MKMKKSKLNRIKKKQQSQISPPSIEEALAQAYGRGMFNSKGEKLQGHLPSLNELRLLGDNDKVTICDQDGMIRCIITKKALLEIRKDKP